MRARSKGGLPSERTRDADSAHAPDLTASLLMNCWVTFLPIFQPSGDQPFRLAPGLRVIGYQEHHTALSTEFTGLTGCRVVALAR